LGRPPGTGAPPPAAPGDQSWRNIRRETARLKQVTLTGQAGTITQTTPLRPEQKAIYQALSITPPPRITAFDPA
jgi:hypothetical protein